MATTATKVATLAKRATQRAVAISGGVDLVHLRAHLTWLSGQMRDVDDNLASLKHTCAEMGERSDWTDPRLSALDETIAFWTHRYQALQAQRTAARTELVSLQAQATATATTRGRRDIYAGQRGAQPIVREAW